jgi:hypothetical protein
MEKKLLFIVIAALAIAGCRKEPEPDRYIDFKIDPTPRWEEGLLRQINDSSSYVFITDMGGHLFESDKYKVGRATANGSDYEIIEFSGTPVVGKPNEPSIRKAGSEPFTPYSLEIVKVQGDMLWIVFKETASSHERRIVQ